MMGQEVAVEGIHPGKDSSYSWDATARERIVMGHKITWVRGPWRVEGRGEGGRWWGITRIGSQSGGIEGSRRWCCTRGASVRAALWAAPCWWARCGWGLVARRVSWGVSKAGSFVIEEVLRYLRVGPERWVEGTRVQETIGAVGTAWTCGKRPVGLPLCGRRRWGATQNRKNTVFFLWWGGGHCDRGRAGCFLHMLLIAHLLLLYLQNRLLWRDRQRKKWSGRGLSNQKNDFKNIWHLNHNFFIRT